MEENEFELPTGVNEDQSFSAFYFEGYFGDGSGEEEPKKPWYKKTAIWSFSRRIKDTFDFFKNWPDEY